MKNLHEWGGPALINSRHYYRNPDPSPKNRRTGAILVIGLISIIILMMIAASSSSQSSGSSARPDNSTLPISHIYIGPGNATVMQDYAVWSSTSGSTGYQLNITFNPVTGILEITNVTTPSGCSSSVNGTVSEYPVDSIGISIQDPNGSGFASLSDLSQFYVSVTSSDSYLITPTVVGSSQNITVGEEWTIAYGGTGGGYFLFPNNPFPPFPVTWEKIGIGPLSVTFPVPDLGGIPGWIEAIFLWAVNELVMIFEELWYKGFTDLTAYATGGINWAMNLFDSLWSAWTGLMTTTEAGAGIFAPVIMALFFGITIVVIIGGLYLIYRIIGAVMSLL